MVCYVPGTGTLALIGIGAYILWHKALGHFLSMVGLAMEIVLILSAEVAVAIVLVWTARMIRRRRAQAGACTTCRFRCQQSLPPRPHLLVNRVDRRLAAAAPPRQVAPACRPAMPRPTRGERPVQPLRPVRPVQPVRPAQPAGPVEPLPPRAVPARESVAFGGYMLTPDGVDGQPSRAEPPARTLADLPL